MKTLFKYRCPTRAPLPQREGLILRYGDCWCEIAPLPGWSCHSLEATIQELLFLLKTSSFPHCIQTTNPSIAWGLEQLSLWNTSACQVPLASLDRLQPGCSTIKCKLGPLSVHEARDKILRFQQQHPICRFRLDFNRMWSISKIHDLLGPLIYPTQPATCGIHIDYLEEPCSLLTETGRLSYQIPCPIALDETLREGILPDFPYITIQKPTLSWSNLVPTKTQIFSSSYETSLGILNLARLAQYHHLVSPQGFDTWTDDLLDPPLQILQGHLVWQGNSKCPIRTHLLSPIITVP
jgi:O-succinylbenzoate synthase